MLLAHKIALAPNNKQATYFAQASGVARFTYNWALAEWKRQYETGEKPSGNKLSKQLNLIKREQFPWMLEVSKTAPQQAIKNLNTAFQNFFKHKSSYPKFKKKGVHDSFRADNGPQTINDDAVKMAQKKIKLPVVGWIRMRQEVRFSGRIISAMVSRQADRWFVSLVIETKSINTQKCESQAAVGVDLGINALATLSNGDKILGPKPRKALLVRMQRLSRRLSSKKKGSSNRKKAKRQLARLHTRIRNMRLDALHKLTTQLTRQYKYIGVETLNVQGMMKNRHLSGAISDMGFFEFKRQLTYKAEWSESNVVEAPIFFASSKTCSTCGEKVIELPLHKRSWECASCSSKHDRDLNAAINLLNYTTASLAEC